MASRLPTRRGLMISAGALAIAGTGARATDKGTLKMAQQDMEKALAAEVAKRDVPGAVGLVSRAGETYAVAVGSTAYDGGAPVSRDTIFRIASITKPMTAAVAMSLVDAGRIRLDEPVDRWLPELANRRVLKRQDGPLDDTVPARRRITLEDLLSQTFGLGFLMLPPDAPISRAMAERNLAVSPVISTVDADAWIRNLGELPLAAEPGEQWMYHTGLDAAGVLIARVEGKPLETVFRDRLFEPLGMADTGFSVPADKLDRLPPCYWNDESGGLAFFDEGGAASRYAKPPPFASGAGGLVSTADDVLAFGRMMLAKGEHGGRQVLSAAVVETMTRDRLNAAQRKASEMFLEGQGWGLGMAVETPGVAAVAAGFGWDGGYGTSYRTDPKAGLVGVLLTQRLWQSPSPPSVLRAFWDAAKA